MTENTLFNKEFIYTGLWAFLIAFASVPIIRRIAFKFKILDIPNKRKMHEQPIPLLGGVSILSGFFGSLLIYYLFNPMNFTSLDKRNILIISIGAVAIFLVGLFDDARGMKPVVKLLCQIAVALFVTLMGVRTSLFTHSIIINVIVSVIWIIGITNAFNLLDNMDGLSSGVAFITAMLFSYVSFFQNNFVTGLLMFIIGFSALGFLPYNFNPAKIFLGDCGSLLLGYLVAILSILGVYLQKSLLTRLPIITPLIILSIPIYDTISVILIRTKLGISIFQADKRHFSHRLVNLGLSVRQAVLVIYLITMATGLMALLLPRVTRAEAIIILIHSVMMFLIIAILEGASYLKIKNFNEENKVIMADDTSENHHPDI